MRVSEGGVSLWYGTPDAQAPSGTLPKDADTSVTIGLAPPDAAAKITVLYRINHGGPLTVLARPTPPAAGKQYFKAELTGFKENDKVEYVAIYRSGTRQIPSNQEAESHVVTFIGPPSGTHSGSTVGAERTTGAANSLPVAPPATGATAGKGPYKISGYVFYDYGLPATGVSTHLYTKGFGGVSSKLGEIITDVNGYYSIAYDVKSRQASLELRATDRAGKEVPLCETKQAAAHVEFVNFVAPASLRPVDPEFSRISADISREIGSLSKLTACREDEQQKDLSLLADATQWDARLIGLVSSAVTIAAQSHLALDLVYALLRAGLPADTKHLARVQPAQFDESLAAAVRADIVRMTAQQRTAATTAFRRFALDSLLSDSSPGAVSSYREMLGKSGLSAAQQEAFAELYFACGSDPSDLWKQAAAQGIPPHKIEYLKLQGCLFQLTFNNAKLAETLQHEVGSLANLARLVDADLHQPEAWKSRLLKLAGNSDHALAASIPTSYGADNVRDRLDAYAADLARRVRMSYPTHVSARLLESGKLSIPEQAPQDAALLAKLLKGAADLGYQMGETPVERFFMERAPELAALAKGADLQRAKQHMKHLHRLHQITPSDESLKALLETGLDSASAVARMQFDNFMARYGKKFPDGEAELVYRKSQQVTSTTFGFSAMAKSAAHSSGGYAISAPPAQRQASQKKLAAQYPTMETLFGSLDFCQCDECRSVLGPAAYLVDLLQFIDKPKAEWQQILEEWRQNHFQADYPFRSHEDMRAHATRAASGRRARAKQEAPTPYEVLIARRPDLPHLRLTCENTNTVMPYIDIVNEIMEYFVVHDSLSADSGHDTRTAKSEDLLAEPENILPRAYEVLQHARYPLSLPFDLWHATARRLLSHAGLNFADLLDTFRPLTDLYPPAPGGNSYGYSAVFLESIGLSPAAASVFTETGATQWHTLYGYDHEAEAARELAFAKTLARRLDISYIELNALIQTGFVNPVALDLGLLWTLNIDLANFAAYEAQSATSEERARFEASLLRAAEAQGAKAADVHAWLSELRQSGAMARLAILAPPADGSCDFGKTMLRLAGGSAADGGLFWRINLFVRLKRILGWSTENLDRALRALLPQANQPVGATNTAGALQTGLLYLSHVHTLQQRLGPDVAKLLCLWGNIDTFGPRSLYAQLFLTASIVQKDAVFRDPFGNYLQDSTVLLADHLGAIQAAIGLGALDVQLCLTDAGQDPTAAVLSLDNVSLLHRYATLAHALHLNIPDFIALKALSGLDPFTPLNPAPIQRLADDHPYKQTIQFVDIAHQVRESGLTVDGLNYLLRHQFDPVGKYRFNALLWLGFVKTLGAGLRAIQAAQTPPTDPSGLTDEILQQKIALVLPADAAAMFMGLWTGTIKQTVTVPGVQPAAQLNPATFAAYPQMALRYDPVTQAQSLTYVGALTDAQSTALLSANPAPLFATLIGKVQAAQQAFFDKALSPFLTPADFQLMLTPAATRAAAIGAKLFPYVVKLLSWQFVTTTLTTNLGGDAALVGAFATQPALLNDPTQSGTALAATLSAIAANALDVSTPSANAQRVQGSIEVPTTGAYRFYAQGINGASLSLTIGDLPSPLFQGSATIQSGEVSFAVTLKAATLYPILLDATNVSGGGITLLVQGESLPKDTLAQLNLYSKAALDGALRAYTLLQKAFLVINTLALTEREIRYLLVQNAPPDGGGMPLSQLPVGPADLSPQGATAIFQQFLNLAQYLRLREPIAGGGDDLIDLFEHALRPLPPTGTADAPVTRDLVDDLASRLATLTRRQPATVRGAMVYLGMTVSTTPDGLQTVTPLRSAAGLATLWRILQLIEKFGQSAQAVARWAVPAPGAQTVEELRGAIKSRYATADWPTIAPTIFDKVRQMKRDALAAFIMHRNGFQSRDELFEYFLVDPGMEPIVQTSRLRLAMSSLQTFIQRCLLNLEPEVQPTVLAAEQWQWMKRYRVWQANREIFLHPENYMEMEFRDDKTDLFQTLEGALLQGDITEDLAAGALFTYLQGLEKISRLEIVTLCAEENPSDPNARTLHVIARNNLQPHGYFYRRYADGMWTAWEAITMTIDGDHVVATIFMNRLNLFWLSFIHQAKVDGSSDSGADSGDDDGGEPKLADTKLSSIRKSSNTAQPPKIVQIQLNWAEHYQGKWSAPVTSGGADGGDDSGGDDSGDGAASGGVGNPISVTVHPNFDPSSVAVHAYADLSSDPHAACVSVTFPEVQYMPHYVHPIDRKHGKKSRPKPHVHAAVAYRPKTYTFRIISKFAPPTVQSGEPQDPPPFPGIRPETSHFLGAGALQVQYVESIVQVDHGTPLVRHARQDIVSPAGAHHQLTVLGTPLQGEVPEIGTLVSPFFYADAQSSFFVEPALTETTTDTWEHWAVPVPRADGHGGAPKIVAAFPRYRPPATLPKGVKPFDGAFDPACLYRLSVATDTITRASAVLHFGGSTVGAEGATGASKPRSAMTSKPAAAERKAGRK